MKLRNKNGLGKQINVLAILTLLCALSCVSMKIPLSCLMSYQSGYYYYYCSEGIGYWCPSKEQLITGCFSVSQNIQTIQGISNNAVNYALGLITEAEGCLPNVYKDSLGFLTIGCGHKLTSSQIKLGLSKLNAAQMAGMLQADVRKAINQVKAYWSSYRIAVLIDMTYNLGSVRWPKFTEALKKRNYELAAKQMMNSKWRTQVKNRAVRNSCIMKNDAPYTKKVMSCGLI